MQFVKFSLFSVETVHKSELKIENYVVQNSTGITTHSKETGVDGEFHWHHLSCSTLTPVYITSEQALFAEHPWNSSGLQKSPYMQQVTYGDNIHKNSCTRYHSVTEENVSAHFIQRQIQRQFWASLDCYPQNCTFRHMKPFRKRQTILFFNY